MAREAYCSGARRRNPAHTGSPKIPEVASDAKHSQSPVAALRGCSSGHDKGELVGTILLLYDTREKDLIRDLKDLLDEINLRVILIPLSASRGQTLEAKERYYLDRADGALFVLTAGSERLGLSYPSPSVCHEMGQAKQKFQHKATSVVYLVEKGCNVPAIDQSAYISFKRGNMRSVLSALTQAIRNFKEAGLFRSAPIPRQMGVQPKKFDIETFCRQLSGRVKAVALELSNRQDGWMTDEDS